jgi:predicted transcriptional regulator
MGRPQTLKNKVRSLARQQTAMQLLAKGEPITSIAEQLGVTPRQVRLYLTASLEAESLYPSLLTPEKVSELRQLEGEKLSHVWSKLNESFEKTPAAQGMVRARLAEACSKISTRKGGSGLGTISFFVCGPIFS